MAEAPKRLSPEEIQTAIHQLAQEGDGADRRWALKQLSVGDAAITLPKPLTEDEINSRLGRQLRGVGESRARRAFGWAFPHGVPISWSLAKQVGQMLTPTNLRELYETFPEAEKNPKTGAPPGYPDDIKGNKGNWARKKWVRDYAIKLNEQRKLHETEAARKARALEMGEPSGDRDTSESLSQ